MQREMEIIERILENSDIVWSRYGSDTIEKLAYRIAQAVTDDRPNNLWEEIGGG